MKEILHFQKTLELQGTNQKNLRRMNHFEKFNNANIYVFWR